ncbi:CCC motif membrane protein [Winogradskyella sp.]|uniref:CCC motif membrane protein n=1 Tax=Winogradskyella sp. TaxID=1883156 RepID=UPI002606D101|nr:CCC motif membrane protein [Winogradskyella sp.]
MEQQKLPNATTSIVLGSISFICCCFSAGIGGLILSGIAYFLAKKDEKLYAEQPDLYSNFSQVKTAKIIAIIGLVLAIIALGMSIYSIVAAGGWEGYMEQQREIYKQMGIEI